MCQQEYAAFKAELATSAAAVATSIAKIESFAIQYASETKEAKKVIVEPQQSYTTIAAQSASAVDLKALFDATKVEVEELKRRALEVEKKSADRKTKWELSRPKDMDPDIFNGKEEAWTKFKEDLMDYADAVHGGIKLQLDWTLKQKDEITEAVINRNPLSTLAEDWPLRFDLYKLLKRKTEATSEARKIVECVSDANGYEVWRLLGVRCEPQVGMKRLKELGELMMLQNKRCKSTAETAMIVLEIDRRKRIIAMVGGKPPDEDVCISILWLSMDAATRAHVTGKGVMESVTFTELRQIVQSYTNLIGSTTTSGRGGGVVAMDIGSIATVGDSSSEWPRERPQFAGGSIYPDGFAQEQGRSDSAAAVVVDLRRKRLASG